MSKNNDLSELNSDLIANFRLKAKILCVFFGVVLAFQVVAILFVSTQTDLIGTTIPLKMVFTGPSLLCMIFISEILAFRYMKQLQGNSVQIKRSFIYLSTFVEVSFPNTIMFLVGNFMMGTALFPPLQVINSPLLIVLFIMIILSSLLLDSRLTFFAGIVAGVEYAAIYLFFLKDEPGMGPVDYASAMGKGVMLVVSGLIAGFVSKRIREAVVASFQAKNELIHHLDIRVAEKTAEVVAQKDEIEKKNTLLEVKQKEILDSIHYARRIQYTQLPTEKYIVKNLGRLSKRSGE